MTVSVMKTIDEHIQKDQEEFLKALSEHNEGKVRHLTEECSGCWITRRNFLMIPRPLTLELFCEQNPDEPSAVYDD